MKPIARFVTRPCSDDGVECDLIIGTMMRNCSKDLDANTVYEIREVLGVLQIVKIGKSLISPKGVKDSKIGVTWCTEYAHTMTLARQFAFISETEYDAIMSYRENRVEF